MCNVCLSPPGPAVFHPVHWLVPPSRIFLALIYPVALEAALKRNDRRGIMFRRLPRFGIYFIMATSFLRSPDDRKHVVAAHSVRLQCGDDSALSHHDRCG